VAFVLDHLFEMEHQERVVLEAVNTKRRWPL
jgi:hypothetical protein